jgi:hypothetical protein
MIRISILLFITSLVIGFFQSCSPLTDNEYACCTRPNKPSDPAFQSYVDEFKYYDNVKSIDVPVYFANLPTGEAGVCHYFRIGNGPIRWGYVEIDQTYWGEISEYQKINLIFHELGHCVLGRDHEPWGNSVMMCPSSFMYYMVLSTECIQNNYDAYIQEMFPSWVK